MTICIPKDLQAARTLQEENIFVMDVERATSQDIRPLHILVLNLMPTKIVTETQLARLLGNTPLQIDMELLTVSRMPKHTAKEHMFSFDQTFEAVKDQYYDGMVITGAPVEKMDFEEVEYWDELCEIMDWSRSHVYSTLHICWGATACVRCCWIKKCSACSGTRWYIKVQSCFAALMTNSGCRIHAIRESSRMMSEAVRS